MNREELYKKTVDVLFQAYFKDELVHQSCGACAVGNICEEASLKTGIQNNMWYPLFYTKVGGTEQVRDAWKSYLVENREEYREKATKLCEATGYTVDELARIEFAFESAPTGRTNEDWMFSGLEAVLEVLKDIHDVPVETNEEAFERFKTHHNAKIKEAEAI